MSESAFSVPTNWDPQLLRQLSGLPVYELFGCMNTTPVGSGRAKLILPDIDEAAARQHIEEAHRNGIAFNYLLNAPCMGNMEYDKHAHGELLEHLAWVDSLGVEAVTVSIPYLVQLIKRQFPRLRVKVSVIASINSVPMARAYRDLGADEINVDYMANRDFRTLVALRDAVDGDLSLLANDLCLYQCPYRQYHYNLTGHSTQRGHPLMGAYFDYCMISCTIEKLTHLDQLLRSPWIRPEDLAHYERIGYSRFKLSGRNMSTPWILRAISAYAARRYHGNLGDILAGAIPEASGSVHFRIDNDGLDGFLDHFTSSNCSTDCARCDHCRSWAERVIACPDPRTKPYLKSYEQLLERLINSDLFR